MKISCFLAEVFKNLRAGDRLVFKILYLGDPYS